MKPARRAAALHLLGRRSASPGWPHAFAALLALCRLGQAHPVWAQQSVSIPPLDSLLEAAVLRQDKRALDTLYAPDFQFSHGTGQHDTKATWLEHALAAPAPFRRRMVDSVLVEVHPGLAVTAGRLWVESVANGRYGWRFVRVWRQEGQRWQLISHRSVAPLPLALWP